MGSVERKYSSLNKESIPEKVKQILYSLNTVIEGIRDEITSVCTSNILFYLPSSLGTRIAL
jgi:hypothetical protein